MVPCQSSIESRTWCVSHTEQSDWTLMIRSNCRTANTSPSTSLSLSTKLVVCTESPCFLHRADPRRCHSVHLYMRPALCRQADRAYLSCRCYRPALAVMLTKTTARGEPAQSPQSRGDPFGRIARTVGGQSDGPRVCAGRSTGGRQEEQAAEERDAQRHCLDPARMVRPIVCSLWSFLLRRAFLGRPIMAC